MIGTINDLKREVFKSIYDVYDVFQNFFGEDFVDLQNLPSNEELIDHLYNLYIKEASSDEVPFQKEDSPYEIPEEKIESLKREYASLLAHIIVWWPSVVVTNENNKSSLIRDLYAKIIISTEGTIPYEQHGFKLTRTTFSYEQYCCGYIHSHIPRFSHVPEYSNPCLGTGPINGTIAELKNGYNELEWMLFCQELSLYVTVESLYGGPYIRMEEIGLYSNVYSHSEFTTVQEINYGDQVNEIIKDFIPYYVKNGHLNFSYNNGIFKCGMPYYNFMIDISNTFIKWFNATGNSEYLSYLIDHRVLLSVKAMRRKFYTDRYIQNQNPTLYEGKDVLCFKGEMKKLCIEAPIEDEEEHLTTILCNDVALYILGKILRTLNYRYTNEYYEFSKTGATEECVAPVDKAVYYI